MTAVTLIPAGWFNAEAVTVPLSPSVISFCSPCEHHFFFQIRICDGGQSIESNSIRTTLITWSICFWEMITWSVKPQAATQFALKGHCRWSKLSTRKAWGKAAGAIGELEQQLWTPYPVLHTEHIASLPLFWTTETVGTLNDMIGTACVPVSPNLGQVQCTGFQKVKNFLCHWMIKINSDWMQLSWPIFQKEKQPTNIK